MTRLFLDPQRLAVAAQALSQGQAAEVLFDGPDHHYLAHVLRRRPGDRVLLLDGEGRQAEAVVVRVAGVAVLRIDPAGLHGPPGAGITHLTAAEMGPRVTLLMGLLKGDKFDLVVQKATELGVSHIIPVLCTRSIARPEGRRAEERQKRWERILRGAAQQCRRPDLPTISPIVELMKVLATGFSENGAALRCAPSEANQWTLAGSLRLLPFEGALRRPVLSVLPARLPAGSEIAVLLGPEGGFAPEEVVAAQAAGFIPCGLGPRILRAETAALAVLAVIAVVCGDPQG